MIKLDNIVTEQKNERTANIDTLSTIELTRIINSEDKKVAEAVEIVLPQIAAAIDVIYEKLDKGGRLFYAGCGTSGRLGILDAVECPPTFGVPNDLVIGLIAGGERAFIEAVEGAEDRRELGEADLIARSFSKADVLVGIAASGRTPYVIGAMDYAKKLGVPVISITCCKGSEIDNLADIGIAPMPGAEVITGSTRLKSGTAQKMVLNMLSTSVMIKLGKVYGNLMVDVKATNEKLVERAVSIVCSATDVSREEAVKALNECNHSAKHAILMIICEISGKEAEEYLLRARGRIREAIRLCSEK